MDLVKYSLRHRLRIDSHVRPVAIFLVLFARTVTSQEPAEGLVSADAAELLDSFVAEVDSLTADFRQFEYDAEGVLVDEPAQGTFRLLRPGRFYWHQQPPFEQIVVADGESVWSYDVDLEQATRAPASRLQSSPAMLLSGETSVSDSYRIDRLPAVDGVDWIELVPVDAAGSDFSSARIGFSGNVPVALELVDGLGDMTRIELSEVEVNTGLSESDFEFDPPRGVDIVEMGTR